MAIVDREQKSFTGNREHLAVLLESIEEGSSHIWNNWRRENPEAPDLKGVDLPGSDLVNYDFSAAAFDDANLADADLTSCELSGANFYRANMIRVKMLHASAYCGQLRQTDLTDANLMGTVFNGAELHGATLTGCKIHGIGRTGWEIDGVKCDYVYTEPMGEGKFPAEGIFEPGEFEKIYKTYPVIDLEFRDGFDALTILVANFAAIQLNKEDDQFDFQVKEVSAYGSFPTIKVSVKNKKQIAEGAERLKQRISDLQSQLEARQLDVNKLFGLLGDALKKPAIQNNFNGQVSIGQFIGGDNLGQQTHTESDMSTRQYVELRREIENSDLPEEKKSLGKSLLDEVKNATVDEVKKTLGQWVKTLTAEGLRQLPRLLDFLS